MTSRLNKGLKSSLDDMLGDLLGDDAGYTTKAKSPARKPSRQGASLPSHSGKRSLLDDEFFSKLAEEAGNVDEDSDVSDADPMALLERMKDMDDMDADLFGPKKKPSSAPAQSKGSETQKDPAKPYSTSREGLDESIGIKKPSSAPASSSRRYKKFSFTDDDDGDGVVIGQTPDTKDLDDPLADLLDDLTQEPQEEEKTKKPAPGSERAPLSPPHSPTRKETAPAMQLSRKRDELTFEDDEDDLMDALGFGESSKQSPSNKEAVLIPRKESSEPPQRARTRLDEILGRGTSPRLLERPPTGERKEQQEKQQEKQLLQEKTTSTKDSFLEEDLAFGSYQPTLASTPEGRQSRRQSVRFSTEDVSVLSPKKNPKASAPTDPPSPSPTIRPRASADWLGLKMDNDGEKEKELAPQTPLSPSVERNTALSTRGPPAGQSATELLEPNPLTTSTTAATSKQPLAEALPSHKKVEDENDWLSGALNRKKNQVASQSKELKSQQEMFSGLREEAPLDSFPSKRGSPTSSRRRQVDTPPPVQSSPPPPTAPHKEPVSRPVPHQSLALSSPAAQTQVSVSADSLQQLLLQQQLVQSQLLGLGGAVDVGVLQRQQTAKKEEQDLQARIIQLEGQVKALQLERDQTQMLLESVQQRHKQDTELMENAHRARVKLLEELASQRETRARQENEDLAERLATLIRLSEQERTELQAQHQRRLDQTQQNRDREVERIRDLQRKSILEMKKDHEEQVQRLKRLKDEEIDAVTSATSQTRSLTVVIEQMEQFSSRLGDLSSRVESTHEHTTQGLQQGARQRDEQLRMMQDRLGQQQRAMAEERVRLQEVIAKMDTQLAEQQRQLEKERWRVTAEQAKTESSQRGLEEERRSLTQHIAMEREELERAKTALLEEQQAVMQRCSEERRRLAAEWGQFHDKEKERQLRLERETSRALERDAHREGSIISMAQEQAELKLRAGELKQREELLARERGGLEKQREELEKEKESLGSTALRLKTRAQEVEAFSKLASEKHEEGERALQEARQVEQEHQARLRSIHSQMDRLRQQEQHLHQERMRMSDQRRELERLRQGLPIPPLPHTITTDFSPVVLAHTLSSPQSTELQARLALLRHTAQKDRDFLQDEEFFLDTLKSTPYNSAFHTD